MRSPCMCVYVVLSVMLAALQSIETELQLQALPPNGGSVHVHVFMLCVCVCVGELEMSDAYSQLSRAGCFCHFTLLPILLDIVMLLNPLTSI